MDTNRQFDFVTIAKGFAIICVVLGHFTPTYMPPFFHQLKEAVYLFHMPLFMLLAGFLYQHSVESRHGQLQPGAFIRKKFLRLMVPYFFLSFSIAALNAFLQQFIPVKQRVDMAYIGRIFYENTGGSATFLWFLYTLFLIFVLASVCRKLPWSNLWLWLLACSLQFIPLPPVLYLNSVGMFLIYFVSGIGFYRLYSHAGQITCKHAAGSAIVFAGVYSLRYYILSESTAHEFLMPLTAVLCGLSACIVILWFSGFLSGRKGPLPRLLKQAGYYSSYIYLLHMAGVYIVRLVYEKVGWYTPFSYTLCLLLAIATGCLLPVLVSLFIIKRSAVLLFLMGEKHQSKARVNKKQGENLV